MKQSTIKNIYNFTTSVIASILQKCVAIHNLAYITYPTCVLASVIYNAWQSIISHLHFTTAFAKTAKNP